MSGVQKLLVVGEPKTGKSSLIQAFTEYKEDNNKKVSFEIKEKKPAVSDQTIKTKVTLNQNSDFSLKIINVDGEKVRLQVWDQGNASDPSTTFQPLFTRHAAGCIVVASTIN